MAYMRGDYYLWSDESSLHLWAYDGYDWWDEAGWHRMDDGKDYPVDPMHLKDGENNASGVSIHQDIMDEYVMMRLAQMVHEGTVNAAIDRATAPEGRGGNVGGMMLAANADTLKQALSGLTLHPTPPYEWNEFMATSKPQNDRNPD